MKPSDKLKITIQEKEIERLKKKLRVKSQKLRETQKKLSRITKQYDKLERKVHGLFGKDQLIRLTKKIFCGYKWSLETIQKSLQLRFACKNK